MLCNSSETASPTANTESRVVDSEIIMDEKGAYSPFCSPDHPSLHYETHIYFPFSNAIPELSSVDDLIRFFKEWRRKNDPLFAIKAHFHACYLGLDTHRELGNHLVPMFVDCGCLSEGQKVFNKLTFQNEHSWTSLIQGCIRQGDCQYAFNLFRLMEQSQVVASSHTFVALLQACAAERLVEIGWELHAEIIKRGHDTDLFVGNVLLDMYFKCFFLEEAHKVFDVLPSHDVVSWNTLISGYVGHGHNEEALRCLEDMQEQGLYCNDLTFIVGLKAATNIGAFDKGLAIHAEIARECHEYSFNLGSTLVDMYAKCGALLEAKDTFNDIVDQDAISWNPLITTYGEHGLEVEALECLKDMKIRGFVPDVVGLIGCMKACGKVGAIRNGHELHAECTKRGIERGAHVGSALIDMYGNLGAIDESEKVFSALTIQSVVTWTALIASYADSGFAEEALHSLEQMQIHSMVPNDITLVCCLKACGSILTIERGREIHMEIVKLGFEKDSLVGSSLVDMYGKCCTLSEANKSFSMLPERGVVAWTALISGYIDSGFNEEALCAFKQMQCEYVMPNIVTFICGLKACGNLTSLSTGLELHKCIIVQGLESEPLVSAALVDMYVNCGSVSDAFRVFEELPAQDVATWNALMAGCIDNGLYEEAIYHFSQMQLEGICPNSITFVLLLKAYGILQAVQRGEELFIRITKQGLDEDPYVGNTLIDFFSKCDRLADAQKVLSNLPIHNVVSWTSLISGYVEHGYYEEAMEYASIMKSEGILPDGGTFICCLKACCHMGAIDRGYETHMELIMESFDNDVLVENTLVDMYAKNACLEEARDVFYEMQVQDVVGWTSLIGGYALYMDGHQTLEIFQQMQLAGAAPDAMTWNNVILGFAEEGESFRAYTLYGQMLEQGLLPNMVTSTNVLKACGSIAALQIGRRIAASAYGQAGLVQVETALENAIMDMYGRCGSMADAQKLFDLMPSRELITWNGLITGYARQGQSDIVFSLMLKMKDEGFQPNQVTLLSALNACNHAGLLNRAREYLKNMEAGYQLDANIMHHNCMIDMLSRAGRFGEALAWIEKMPVQPNLVSWITVLNSCQIWGNVELGKYIFENLQRSDAGNRTAFVLMGNIYANANMWDQVRKIEIMRESLDSSETASLTKKPEALHLITAS
ncbi:hypothetical protein KP509_15G056400 [Ceratopteris richardii]|nr:hypothetical protein KP509_15G056400 [Ceratopteris richardii]